MSTKIGVQKISLVDQEKFREPEKCLNPQKHGSITNVDKKGLSLQKNLGTNNFFASNKAHIELTTSLIEF